MENNEVESKKNTCNKFPLTKYFYKVGKDRWNEPINHLV